MKSFKDFADKADRKNKKQLKIVHKLFEQGGLKVVSYIDEDEPYIFVQSTKKGHGLSFEGVRVYHIGGGLAYRVQKNENTHPYGRAYLLNVEDVFNDLISDNKSSEDAAKEVIKTLSQDLEQFFEKSQDAEVEIENDKIQKSKDPLGRVVLKSTGTDYSNKLSDK